MGDPGYRLMVKLLTENNKRPCYLAQQEFRALANASEFRMKLVTITALITGMRGDEICSLKWETVDLLHGHNKKVPEQQSESDEICL